jgi:hypothetical protein
MKPRSRVAKLAVSAVAAGGLALAPAVITAAPAAADGSQCVVVGNIHACSYVTAFSSGGTGVVTGSWTDTITVNGKTTTTGGTIP